MIKTRSDNYMINGIGLVYAKTKIDVLGPIEPCAVWTKTRQDNDMINYTSVIYAKNQIRQQCDQSYNSCLH